MSDADNFPVKNEQIGWNSLPPELKIHCIKEMDFKARSGLRCSSKTEMRLVDSVKYSLKHVIVILKPKESDFHVTVFNGSETLIVEFNTYEEENEEEEVERTTDLSVDDPRLFQMVADFLKQILTTKIDYLELRIESDGRGDKDQKLITDIITQGPVLNVKKLEIPLNPVKPIGIETLKRCSSEFLSEIVFTELEVVDIDFFENFVLIPQVIGAQKLEVSYLDDTDEKVIKNKVAFLTALYKQWALDGAPIGKELIVGRFPDVFQHDVFVPHYRPFLVRHDETLNAMLLKTCDSSKCIWIRVAPDDKFFQMFVVDADSEEPDFKKMDEARNPSMAMLLGGMNAMLANDNFVQEIRDFADAIGPGEPEDFEYDLF